MVLGIADSDDDGASSNIISHANYLLGNRHRWKANILFLDQHSQTVKTMAFHLPDVKYGSYQIKASGNGIEPGVYSTGTTVPWNVQPIFIRYSWGIINSSKNYLTQD